MTSDPHDPRDIPILTDVAEGNFAARAAEQRSLDVKAVHAAILTETLQLADSLLHQAAKDIEAILFEKVFDRLRAALPELIDRTIREHDAAKKSPVPYE